MLFHCWIPGQFFADGVAGYIPCELISPFYFCGVVGCFCYFVVADVEVVVVAADGFGEGFGHGELLVRNGVVQWDWDWSSSKDEYFSLSYPRH